MTRYYYGVVVVSILIVLVTTSLGWCGAQQENQGVLANSKIKKNIFPKVFRDIKRTLPKELRQCPIVVTDIKLLKTESDAATEDWTVNICQETKVYCVQAYWLKGSYLESVKSKEEVLARQKAIWETAKKIGNEEEWRDTLFYIDEIEAMKQSEKGKIENEGRQ